MMSSLDRRHDSQQSTRLVLIVKRVAVCTARIYHPHFLDKTKCLCFTRCYDLKMMLVTVPSGQTAVVSQTLTAPPPTSPDPSSAMQPAACRHFFDRLLAQIPRWSLSTTQAPSGQPTLSQSTGSSRLPPPPAATTQPQLPSTGIFLRSDARACVSSFQFSSRRLL